MKPLFYLQPLMFSVVKALRGTNQAAVLLAAVLGMHSSNWGSSIQSAAVVSENQPTPVVWKVQVAAY